MNQHTADLIEAIENHPAIDWEDRPEYMTLAGAYEDLREMAVDLAEIVKKTQKPDTNSVPRKYRQHPPLIMNKTVDIQPNGDVTITGTFHEMNIQPGQILKARSIGDYDCIYEIKIMSRTAKMATFTDHRGIAGETRTSKIHKDERGEYLRPDRWSFAPTFRPEPAPENVIEFHQPTP